MKLTGFGTEKLLLTAFLLTSFWVSMPVTARAVEPEPWTEGLVADPEVTSPEEFLGRPFGEGPMSVDEIVGYCRVLAASSSRVELETLGQSVQGTPLILLSITDPASRPDPARRQRNFQAIRDPWGVDREDRREAARSELPVVWVGCSVHGDEASGADAGIALAYRLAADLSPDGTELMRHVVVLVDPMQNPDGRRRFLQHIRSFGNATHPDPSPWAAEHNQLWPGGRTNHFLFDLNRDWAFETQPETRARVPAFLRWRPQVFVDLHEMGRRSSYYFPPPSEPINPNVPESVLDWFDSFGRANAHAFEQRGYDYFVRETFDLFYPGYGDSWPTLQGAIGMTFEQASTRGRSLVQRAGQVVGYAEAVAHHYVAARTTVETAATYGSDLMQSVVDFYDQTRERADSDPRREVVISAAAHPSSVWRLGRLLDSQGIRVLQTLEPTRARMRDYDANGRREVDLPAGSLRIPLRQADYALLRSLVDPETELSRRFLDQEKERRRRGLQNRFYDVTAWSVIYSFGVEAHWSERDLDVPCRPLPADPEQDALWPALEPESGQEVYAWLVPYRDPDDVACLSDLWKAGISVACALEDLEIADRSFPRGTLVIPHAANRRVSDLEGRLADITRRHEAELVATPTGWSQSGPSLGSSQVRFLRPPRIGVFTGPGLRSLSAGAASWMLEERYGVDFTSLLFPSIDEIDLRDFDTLLLPELEPGTELPLERLHRWVQDGGVLVALGTACDALLAGDVDFGSVQSVDDLAELADDNGMLGEFEVGRHEDQDDEDQPLPDDRRPLRTPGAILRVDVDPTHPLSLGQLDSTWVPYLSSRLLVPSIGGKNVVTVTEERPRAAGFMWPVMEEAVRGKAYLVEESIGRGAAVLFAEDPGFRGVWEGLHHFLLNALLIRPSLLAR